MSSNEQYDIIFAGGGASACITAGRLAAADSSLKILILEAGTITKELPEHTQPARYFSNLIAGGPTLTLHASKPSQNLAGRSVIVPMGRCVGGGSSVNFAMYTRAAASDYDDWETVYKNPGWSSKEIIPLLKKAESFERGNTGAYSTHGVSGPLKISYAKSNVNVATEFLNVAAQWDKERGFTEDMNGFFNCDAYGQWPRYVDWQNGRRSDTAHSYVYNQSQSSNLKILPKHRVVRVIFEGKRAVGVECVDDAKGRGKTGQALEALNFYASRLVVLSAGAFGTPAILERSGIGSRSILAANNIRQFVDLPGVGEHYMDHNVIFCPYITSEDADTLDVVFRGSEKDLEPFVKQWTLDGQGLLSLNAVDAGVKLRPHQKDLYEIGPSFTPRWKEYFENAPDKPALLMVSYTAHPGATAAPHGKSFCIAYFTAYPISTGRVHIQSGLDPYGPLAFEPGYLTDPADVDILRWGYKVSRELARRMKFVRGEFWPGHPTFPEGSAAAIQHTQPADIDAPDIEYTEQDNKAIDDFHRRKVETSWHSIGTCAMKPREQGGVVDPRLNVYGVENLKIADCSITPYNVSANTYNTAIAIGEKAAVIIAEDLGISGVTKE